MTSERALAADRGGPGATTREMACASLDLAASESGRIREAGASAGVGVFELLQAAFHIMLSRYVGSDEVHSALRMPRSPEPTGGLGVDLQVEHSPGISTESTAAETMGSLARQIQAQGTRRLAEAQRPLEDAVGARGEVVPNLFWWHGDEPRVAFSASLEARSRGSSAGFDLELHAGESAEGVHAVLMYDRARFAPSRMEVFLEQWAQLLRDLPGTVTRPADLLKLRSSADERLPRLETQLPPARSRSRIFDAFLDRVRARPDAVAIRHGTRAWTYAELENASRALALELLERGCTQEHVVAILARRGPAVVTAMLGALRAGAAFSVLDAGYPSQRIAQQARILRPDQLLVCGNTAPEPDLLALLPGSDRAISVADELAGPDQTGSLPSRSRGCDRASPDALAYLLFTSGTTGMPKCVAATHGPLVHFVEWQAARFALGELDRFSMLSGLGHDPVLRDVFTPLSIGAELHIPEREVGLDPQALFRWMSSSRITVMHATPQMCLLVRAGVRGRRALGSLHWVFCGGDALLASQARQVLEFAPEGRVVNFYGSTETPQAMGFHVFDPAEEASAVPLGVGIADTQLLVMRRGMQTAGVGEIGQIAIRTRYLSLGYRGAAEEPSARFQANPATGDPDDRIYLTGDYGYFRPNGSISFRGRLDDQIKIRGFRVELSEITRCLLEQPGVGSAIAVAKESESGEKRIAAYLVAEGAGREDGGTDSLHEAMCRVLPGYMVPSAYVWLDAMPLLPNGKVDRAALPVPTAQDAPRNRGYVCPVSEPERQLVADWERILNIHPISVSADFLSLGGDSLSSVQASASVEAVLGWLPRRWEAQTIKDLAAQAREERSAATEISTSVFLRAVSIALVVAAHFGLVDVAGGTAALFLLSGNSFAKYQLNALTRTGTLVSAYKLMVKIAAPTVAYTLLLQLKSSRIRFPTLLLYSNFLDPNYDGGLGFWFVMVLLQCLAILTLLLAWGPARRFATRSPFRYGLALLAASWLASALGPLVWNTDRLYDRVPHMALWFMAAGWCIAYADTSQRKLGTVVLLAALTMASATLERDASIWFPFLGGTAIMLRDRIPLPNLLGALVNTVASASLFIYLTHFQIGSILSRLLGVKLPVLGVAIGLAGGVLAWKAWEAGVRLAASSVADLRSRWA